MNKFITSTSLLSIGLLASCSTINGFRQDPDTWGKKEEKEKTQTISKPEKLTKPPTVISKSQPTNYTSATTTSKKVNNVTKKTTQNGRIIAGFIEPNVTKLPDNKDLQESNNIAPIPVLPRLETPVAPLLPDAIDPTSPLPSNP